MKSLLHSFAVVVGFIFGTKVAGIRRDVLWSYNLVFRGMGIIIDLESSKL